MRDGHDDVVRRLVAACDAGDGAALAAVLAPDAVAVCDSGGRVPAPALPVHGAAAVARLLLALLPGTEASVEAVNGSTGLALRRGDAAVAVVSISSVADEAVLLWIVLNPGKLHGWHRR